MGRPLRVLLVEDAEDDAKLLLRELRRQGFEPTTDRVDSPEALEKALVEGQWEAILSDYTMPRLSALTALEIVKAHNLDVPFIIVSGTIGEETAVSALKAGAHDFLLKDRLARLGAALERELREAAHRAERRKLQEQLVLSDRMVSVGTLAAGVAHEINNPLAAVLANLEYTIGELEGLGRSMTEREGQRDRPMADRLADIMDATQESRQAADRVRAIVRDLKLFSRPDEERRGPLDVRKVLDSTLRMAENEIRHRAKLVKSYEDVPFVEGNDARLGQVFLNLVVNAAQAMADGRADTNVLRIVVRRGPSATVVVEVHDTGSGISDKLLPHVFEPFFTTKPVGIGTGLGLAICHRIVTSLNGTIQVESEMGRGTVFRVVLPASNAVTLEAAPPVSLPKNRSTRARVLVVDDDAMVGIALSRLLLPDHDVTALTAARAACERIVRGERYDVIFCNVMMPFMTGADFHAEIERTVPEQAERIVFMTGGPFTPAARDFLDHTHAIRVEKPFDTHMVRSVVERFVA